MDCKLYFLLSTMMFLEFAVWGAWAPVLAARLLGTLKFNGKQTGWIYATIPLACIVSPLIAGQIADRWVATEWLLAGGHLLGSVFLLMAVRCSKFKGLFVTMLLYAACYTFTLPLVNSLMFSHLTDSAGQSPMIFIWAPVAWVLVGLALTGWRRVKGTGKGNDCLIFAGVLSVVMGVFCFFLPHTPPQAVGGDMFAFVSAFSMLGDFSFLLFIIVSFVVTAQLQFYFLGTAQYLQDIGVQSKNVPAVMTIAQIAQSIVTVVLLGWLLSNFGFRWTLAIGVLCWLLMYIGYAAGRPKKLVIGSQALHGLAYVLFLIGGQIYVDSVAPDNIKSSAQALLFVITIGFGLLAGTQFTGAVMDKFNKDGRFQWRPIFLVPCVLLLICTVVFAVFFRG